jgi:hypothetical protein
VSHKGIRLLLEDTARSLGDDIQFDYGRTSDFNQLRDKRYPFISSGLFTAQPSFAVNNVTNYSKLWRGEVTFYNLDKEDSGQDQYALILDEMDDLLDRFVNKLNTYSYNTCITSDDIVITFGQQTAFIKATADILTGWIIPIEIRVTDDFNYCGLGC